MDQGYLKDINIKNYTFRKKNEDLIDNNNFVRYVCFRLNEQEFGINVQNVIEVIPLPEITPVVHTPNFIKGVINLRGRIIAIIDLKVFFYLKHTDIGDDSKIVVVQSEDKVGGFIVDSISQINTHEEVKQDSIPATVTGKMAEYLSGVAKISGRPLMIINLSSLFNSEEFKQFEQ